MSELTKQTERPPVVVIMGHIDHGKSTLLDYIRKSKITAGEAGGITQHIGAYEIEHDSSEHGLKRITFLDTPGHESFTAMRERGAKVADIAVLIVSAEDGVKAQTMEAHKVIMEDKLPYIVAINKIDSPKANIEKTKSDLLEHEIYLEGFGGQIPYVTISAHTGENIPEFLDTIILLSQVEEHLADPTIPAEGVIVEAHKNPKKGITATLVIKTGVLNVGETVACHTSLSPIRMIEDSYGKNITTASFSTPVIISGWTSLPPIGSKFKTFKSKKDAEKYCEKCNSEIDLTANVKEQREPIDPATTVEIPIIIKTDVSGTAEAIEYELRKLENERVRFKIIKFGTGNISEIDMKFAAGKEGTIVTGFGVGIDPRAEALRERDNIQTKTFTIIYEMTEWLSDIAKDRKPLITTEETTGLAKILRIFNQSKNRHVVGARITEGIIKIGEKVKILRRGEQIDTGIIKELQHMKVNVKEVIAENEFGMAIDSKLEIAEGDMIEAFEIVKK